MRIILVVLISIVISACAVTSPKNESQLLKEQKAMVLGHNDSLVKEIFTVIGTTTNLKFTELNGKKFEWSLLSGSGPDTLELDPGKHTISVVCFGEMERNKYSYNITGYEIEVEAGHIYQMKAKAHTTGCNISHEDVTK